MDWTLAIERNRDALFRMLALLIAAADGGSVAVMPRHRHTLIWRVLRPAEAALRRLIVVVQYVMGIKATHSGPRAAPSGVLHKKPGAGTRLPAFALFDSRKRFAPRRSTRGPRPEPRIRYFDDIEIFTPKPVFSQDDMISAEKLCQRLQALQRALEDLPKQARRLARWQAKREQVRAKTGRYIGPIRPGKPPGHKDRKNHPVDHILGDCHALALYVLQPPDTS